MRPNSVLEVFPHIPAFTDGRPVVVQLPETKVLRDFSPAAPSTLPGPPRNKHALCVLKEMRLKKYAELKPVEVLDDLFPSLKNRQRRAALVSLSRHFKREREFHSE